MICSLPSLVHLSVLVGNKCDLDNERTVKYKEGAELAAQWGCPFFETSAKEKINNEACFFELVREVRKMEKVNPVVGKKKKMRFCVLL